MSRTQQTFKAVIFDFGGVLTNPMDDTAVAFAQEIGLSTFAYRDTVAFDPAGRALYAQLERGDISQTEWNQGIAGILGIDANNLMGRALATLAPEKLVVNAAQSIRAAGLKTAILSNSMGLEPFNPYTPWDLEANHDVIVFSEQHRIRKPDAAIYQLTLDKLGLPGSACIFVDDNPSNLIPAQHLGMATVHATTPVETVAKLQQLLGIPLD
ncbi:HAD family hydrolase [Streptomyces sp. NBC_01296]|uniref:HAD family hydrolase n=1 Tax=Streptomyces sp. NBC_01296 TaxID=2903816 RepID=UPI002E165A41|nr:HAD family phosphatase [Streptomyces sp. NBC_01296]